MLRQAFSCNRTSRLRRQLFAGIAVLPLMLAPALAFEDSDSADVTIALEQAATAQEAAGSALAEAAILLQERADLILPELPPDVTALAALTKPPGWLDGAVNDDDLTTASLSMPRIFDPEPLTLPPPASPMLTKREETPFPVVASGEMFDPALPLRPSVAAAPAGDLALLKQALIEARRTNLPLADALAEKIEDRDVRAALEWSVIRLHKQALGARRIARFVAGNPDFPMRDWLDARIEDALFADKTAGPEALEFIGGREPTTAPGMIVKARALKLAGDEEAARTLARRAYRDGKTNAALRSAIGRDFPGLIGAADQRYLAQRLIYDGATSEGLRVAQEAGPAVRQLAELLAASVNETGAAGALLGKLDPALAKEPAALFARVQHLRRAKNFSEAAKVMLSVPDNADAVIDGDEWWIERRMLARKLLDAGDAATAYRIAAAHHAEGSAFVVDAEVHAGWLALRFLNDSDRAIGHFERARAAATAPASLARADYWRGRALEAGDMLAARAAYTQAGAHRHTFYGQLALAALGEERLAEPVSGLDSSALEQATRAPALRAIRALLDTEARDLAQPLIIDAARQAPRLEASVALGDLVARYNLPRLTLLAGKMAMQKGLKAEEHAFPSFGIPPFDAAPQSAEAAIVYAIARQESEFEASAVSHAGARGLMQLMPATARRTAQRFRIPFDVGALTRDPALNARIGAAHLGELFGEYRGSYILSFAAYNAGGGRVKEWMDAYGDPRDPAVDPIDWIERIPITETRHYVQKIFENVQIYRVRLTGEARLGIASDLKRGLKLPKDPVQQIAVSVPPVGEPAFR